MSLSCESCENGEGITKISENARHHVQPNFQPIPIESWCHCSASIYPPKVIFRFFDFRVKNSYYNSTLEFSLQPILLSREFYAYFALSLDHAGRRYAESK